MAWWISNELLKFKTNHSSSILSTYCIIQISSCSSLGLFNISHLFGFWHFWGSVAEHFAAFSHVLGFENLDVVLLFVFTLPLVWVTLLYLLLWVVFPWLAFFAEVAWLGWTLAFQRALLRHLSIAVFSPVFKIWKCWFAFRDLLKRRISFNELFLKWVGFHLIFYLFNFLG